MLTNPVPDRLVDLRSERDLLKRRTQVRMNDSVFVTERLPLAISIHASGRLRFVGCNRAGLDRVEFVFDDPHGAASDVELEFDRGTLTVVASEIFASQKYLRRRMSEVLENRRTNNGNKSRQC